MQIKTLNDKENNYIIKSETAFKVIAFYLPQYHPIPENDKWWGKGFTEWTNVTKARPLFNGHYQPRLPADLGFYDLRIAEVRKEQAHLAKKYGLYGFCYYYYWFSGKTLLDMPLKKVIESGEPDFPFCICFANENWTRQWDGQHDDILMKQEHSPENDRRFIRDIIPFMNDSRYIRVNGKPLLLVYRPKLFSNSINTTKVWREEAKKAGIEDLFLCKCQTRYDFSDPTEDGFNAVVEFPPHSVKLSLETEYKDLIRSSMPDFRGNVFDYTDVAIQMMSREWPEYKLFKTVMLGWDNTARRKSSPSIFHNFSIDFYERWLSTVLKRTIERYPEDERLVFINAWNEWAEGTYLEPDQKFGIEYLKATERAIQSASGWEEVQRCFHEFIKYAKLDEVDNRGVLDYLSKYTIEYSLAKRLGDKEEELFMKESKIAVLEAALRHVSETTVADLKNKLADKDEILQKVLSHFYRIIPMNLKTRPSVIADKISVIIPVKNSGGQLRGLLQKIKSQRKVKDVEIIVIDSESTDNSVDVAMEYGAKVIKIPQREFNHGATRNLGAKEAKGDFLVFTVQDAMPINDYWLYNMICPFLEYPELTALSSKQFVKLEADLCSLWMSESLIKSFGLAGDTIYSLSDAPKEISLDFFDSVTKRRLTFFDNVSSCIKRRVFEEIQFAPLINAEDIDYGVRLIERKKTLGYLSSTGVYRWHERGADYVFKQHYIDTKTNVYTLKNEVPYFFDINNIGWEALLANITGLYDLISIVVTELDKISIDPVGAIRSFTGALHKNIETMPYRLYMIKEGLREKDFYGEKGLNMLLKEIAGDTFITPEQKYNFNQNFLIPDFMRHFENFTTYLCSKHHTLKGREKDFISCLYKIYAMTAGEALGAYYLEAETLNRLTPDLKKIDQLLGKGVCYF